MWSGGGEHYVGRSSLLLSVVLLFSITQSAAFCRYSRSVNLHSVTQTVYCKHRCTTFTLAEVSHRADGIQSGWCWIAVHLICHITVEWQNTKAAYSMHNKVAQMGKANIWRCFTWFLYNLGLCGFLLILEFYKSFIIRHLCMNLLKRKQRWKTTSHAWFGKE